MVSRGPQGAYLLVFRNGGVMMSTRIMVATDPDLAHERLATVAYLSRRPAVRATPTCNDPAMSEKTQDHPGPDDFTKVADLRHGACDALAGTMGAEVYLLHVVPKASEAEEACMKLDMDIKRARSIDASVPVHKLVRIGSIFEDIGDAGHRDRRITDHHGHAWHARHAVHHRQPCAARDHELLGAVHRGSGARHQGGWLRFHRGALDLHKETRQKLTLVADMAKYFQSKVHLITSPRRTMSSCTSSW